MRGLYSHSREYRKICLRDHCPHISQILEGLHFGAHTCRACIRTRANTGKNSWRIIHVLVSCQGTISALARKQEFWADRSGKGKSASNHVLRSVALVLLEALKIPEVQVDQKVGPKVGFGGFLRVGQKSRSKVNEFLYF